jgi:hypothetical protein
LSVGFPVRVTGDVEEVPAVADAPVVDRVVAAAAAAAAVRRPRSAV